MSFWFDFFKGSFASLTAVFSFRRRTESFISSIFVPSIVLVVLSWCCFYISPAAVPARVALSITTILTSILLKGNVNRDMPKVSYMKAVDYFMLTSFGFIFAALIEYIIVLNSDPVLPSWCKRRQKMDEKQKFTVVSEVSKEKSGLINSSQRIFLFTRRYLENGTYRQIRSNDIFGTENFYVFWKFSPVL